jgi:hypothetical protein
VLIVEIDGINPEPLGRAFDRLLDVLWPTIQPQKTRLSIGLELIAELGGYDYHAPLDTSEVQEMHGVRVTRPLRWFTL